MLALVAGSAAADPVSIIAAIGASIGGVTGAAMIMYAGVIATGLSIAATLAYSAYGNSAAKRQQRAAADRARSAAEAGRLEYNAGLQDRMTTNLSGSLPQRTVYGTAFVGGGIVAMFTSNRDETPGGHLFAHQENDKSVDALKHLVVVFAAHECQALGEIMLDGSPLGPLDSNGYPISGVFAEPVYAQYTHSGPMDGVGRLYLPASPAVASIVSFTLRAEFYSPGNDMVQGSTSYSESPIDATFMGDYVQFPTGYATAPYGYVGWTVRVTYNYQVASARVRVIKHLGGPTDPADPYLMSIVPSKWTSAHVLRGYSYIVLTLDVNEPRFQGGPPGITCQVAGKKVYDPRNGLTVYSENNALCVADFLQSKMWRANSRIAVLTADLIASANVCDQDVGGGVKRYRCNGSFSADEGPENVLESLVTSMAGFAFVAGGWRILAGAWTTPVATLELDETDGSVEITQVSAQWSDIFNGVKGNYVPRNTASATDIKPYQNTVFVAADGEELWSDMSMPYTDTLQGCHDLARIFTERSRNGMTLRWPASMKYWGLQPGDRVYVNHADFGLTVKTFRVTDWEFSLNSPVTLTLQEDTALSWDRADAVVADQAPNTDLPDPYTLPAVEGLTASSGTSELVLLGDGTIVPTIHLTWTPLLSGQIMSQGWVEVQSRLDNGAPDAAIQAQRLPGDQVGTVLSGYAEGQIVLSRVRYRNTLALGAWSVLSHAVLGKTEPPPSVQSFTVRNGVLSWPEVVALDLAGYEIRFNYAINDTWGTGTPLHTGLITSSPWSPSIFPPGQVTLMIRARDNTGNYSLVSAVIYVNLGDVIEDNLILSIDEKALGFPGIKTNSTVVSGDLIADDSGDLNWGLDEGNFWSPVGAGMYWPGATFDSLRYETFVSVTSIEAGSRMTLEFEVTGQAYSIDYRYDPPAAYYGLDGAAFWGADALSFWPGLTPWVAWPGALPAVDVGRIELRVTTQAGAVRGRVEELIIKFDVEDEEENIDDVVISPLGTRLTLARAYREIKNIQLTLQSGGGTAVTAQWVDKLSTGPLIICKDSAGTQVAGVLDARVQGVKG